MVVILFILALLALNPQYSFAQLAFPTAEGFGRFATGGRGGTPCFVTNTNDSGAGSLRACMETTGTRTVIFRVGGTITLSTSIGASVTIGDNLTVACQTAPGDGVMIKGTINFYISGTKNVIMRHCRIRPGVNADGNALVNGLVTGGITSSSGSLIFDHMSLGWSNDDIIGADNVGKVSAQSIPHNITVQWSNISESTINSAPNASGGGAIVLGTANMHYSFLHNACANIGKRCVHIQGGDIQFNNNVISNSDSAETMYALALYGRIKADITYNWFVPNTPGGHTPGSPPSVALELDGGNASLNSQSNLYFKGNVHTSLRTSASSGSETAMLYTTGGVLYDSGGAPHPIIAQGTTAQSGFPILPFTRSAIDAKAQVIANSGAKVPIRDAVDTLVASDINTNAGRLCGVTESATSANCATFPTYNSASAPTDTDNDGIPDSWELSHGLNPNNTSDGAAITPSGYSNLEWYINELAGDVYGVASRPFAASSMWNQQIGAGSTFTATGVSSTNQPSFGVEAILIHNQSINDPAKTIIDTNSDDTACNGTSGATNHFTHNVPDGFLVTGRINNGIAVFPNESGSTIGSGGTGTSTGNAREQYDYERCTSGSNAAGRYSGHNGQYALNGDGYVTQGARGGSYISGLGGTVQEGEFTAANGKAIPHKLTILFNKDVMYYNSGIGITSSYKYPAKTSDGYRATLYLGTNPELIMGALITVRNLTCSSLRTIPGQTICNTLAAYGGYIGDTTYNFQAWTVSVQRKWNGSSIVGAVENEVNAVYGISLTNPGQNTASNNFLLDMRDVYNHTYTVNSSQQFPSGPPGPTLVSCTVYDGAATTVETCYDNPLTSPMGPANGVTGLTFKKNDVDDPVTSTAIKAGSTVCFNSTVSNAFAGGNSLKCSYSQTGNLTSSNGSGVEVAAITDFLGTNQTSSPATASVAQRQMTCELADFAEYYIPWDRCQFASGETFRLRSQLLVNTALTGNAFQLVCSDDGGSNYYTVPVADGSKRVNYGLDETLKSLDIPANKLNNGGNTFYSGARVYTAETAGVYPSLNGVPSARVMEFVFVLKMTGTVGQQSQCRVRYGDNTNLNTYTVGDKIITLEPNRMHY